MVHSSDNETALYQELDYLQVKEMMCAHSVSDYESFFFFFFFGSGWKLFTVSGDGAR